ncbi:hypothetical protein [Kribbella monticola]|uniref:hypothetical protein n=1 Tax=Kribbella monticola TaxID=2185285 RepID=UPI00130037F0|nr:hypothetical protein [Kribbella monticola]
MAEGVLLERYGIPVELARALIEARAAATGLSPDEVAHRLCATGVLPEGPGDDRDGYSAPETDA